MKTPTKDQVIVYIYIAGAIIGAYFIYKVMGRLGLVETKRDREEKESIESLRTLDYFDPMILENRPSGYVALGESKGNMYAEILHNAIAGLGTDEEAIYSVFGKLNNKYNIAEIAGYYQVNYLRDLSSDILGDLSDSEKTELMNIIKKLPTK
jgi:hypothetical protein